MTAWSDWRAAAVHRLPVPVRRMLAIVARLAAETFKGCFRYRVTGLAAEAAFFTILSVPPLIFGLAGAVGFVAQQFNFATIESFQSELLALASRVLNEQSVQAVIAPTLTDVLSGGRYSVISIGFVLALWSGSRALNVFLDTITIMYGLGGRRSLFKTRGLSFVFYLVILVVGVVLVPLALAGPDLIDRLLPDSLGILGDLYWPVLLISSVLFLTTLYHLAVPVRSRWRTDLPGAGLSLLIWLGGSALLKFALNASTGSTTIYGPLAAPIAILIWLYVMSLAVLIGAAFNSAIDVIWPNYTGVDHDQEHRPDESITHPLEARSAALASPGEEVAAAVSARAAADADPDVRADPEPDPEPDDDRSEQSRPRSDRPAEVHRLSA